MLTLPKTEMRAAQLYIYVPFTVTMRQMQRPANEGFPLLFAHLDKHGLKPVGDAFYNYRRINMQDTLDVEAGIAVEAAEAEVGAVLSGILPSGRFATATWHGHPDGLIDATGQLIDWVNSEGMVFDMEPKSNGEHFACRLEIYESDPVDEPDMDKWVTTLAFKLKD
jgi:hypothetical protein